jgi:hypothetical protein
MNESARAPDVLALDRILDDRPVYCTSSIIKKTAIAMSETTLT